MTRSRADAAAVVKLQRTVDRLERTLAPDSFEDAIAELDVHLLLTAAKLDSANKLEARLRNRIVDALRQSRRRKEDLKAQQHARREEAQSRPVHVPIGKGATMVLWQAQ